MLNVCGKYTENIKIHCSCLRYTRMVRLRLYELWGNGVVAALMNHEWFLWHFLSTYLRFICDVMILFDPAYTFNLTTSKVKDTKYFTKQYIRLTKNRPIKSYLKLKEMKAVRNFAVNVLCWKHDFFHCKTYHPLEGSKKKLKMSLYIWYLRIVLFFIILPNYEKTFFT